MPPAPPAGVWRASQGPVVSWSLLALLAAATLAEPLGSAGPLPSGVALAAGCVLAVAAARLPSRSRSTAAAVAVVAVAAAAGGMRVARFEEGPLIELARSGGTREMAAVVIAEPQVEGERWWTIVSRPGRPPGEPRTGLPEGSRPASRARRGLEGAGFRQSRSPRRFRRPSASPLHGGPPPPPGVASSRKATRPDTDEQPGP